MQSKAALGLGKLGVKGRMAALGTWRGRHERIRGGCQVQTLSWRFLPRACPSPTPICPTQKGDRQEAPCSLLTACPRPRTQLKQVLISAIDNLATVRVQEACVDWPGKLSIRYNDVSIRKCTLDSKFLANTSFLDWGLPILGGNSELLLSPLT